MACVGLCWGCCRWFKRCRLRDFCCCKAFLRVVGHDAFDDFKLMVLVHYALFDKTQALLKKQDIKTQVKVTAGSQTVLTDPNSKSTFQQPLHVFVEQGTPEVKVELLDSSSKVLAVLRMDIVKDILAPKSSALEQVYHMQQKGKTVRNPKIVLTLSVHPAEDLEDGSQESQDPGSLSFLVRQQMKKAEEIIKADQGNAKEEGEEAPHVSETVVMKQACSGPLEIFENMGKIDEVWVAVLGPPSTRRWIMGVWNDKNAFDRKYKARIEIDLLRIEGVQADPTRENVFMVNYVDEHKAKKRMLFRRIDRARDVWVEMLQMLVSKARNAKQAEKTMRLTQSSISSALSAASRASKFK